MLAVLTVALRLLSPLDSGDWDTYVVGSMYSLVEYGCQRKEDALKIAHTYHDEGHSEVWALISEIAKEVSADGRAMCAKIHGDVVLTSTPAFETDVETEGGVARHLSVVYAHTVVGNFYWLLMLDSRFVTE